MRSSHRAHHPTGPQTPPPAPAHVVTRSLAGYDVLLTATAAPGNTARSNGTTIREQAAR
jgi:hypothetical protein